MEQKIIKIKQELQANYKFIKYDGLILETFASNLLKLCNCDVNKTIEYLETLSKKYITDKFICIVKDFETSFEISEIIKSSIQIETDKLKVKQTKVNELDKETDELLEYKEELKADLAKLKAEHKKTNDDYLEFEEELKADLAKLEITKGTLQNTIDGVYRNELYEDEFNIPECKYILKEPTIHLNVDKIIEDLGLPEFSCITKNELYFTSGEKIIINFPIYVDLDPLEYIIKIYYSFSQNINIDTTCNYCYFIIYMTNYGRMIKSDKIIIGMVYTTNRYNNTSCYKMIKNKIKIIQNNILYDCGNSVKYIHSPPDNVFQHESMTKIICSSVSNFVPALTFRMPRIFLDVIDAFYTQNNDLMQECCKRYLDITRETARKTEILTTLQFNKTIKEKDDIITRKENIIKEHSVIIDYQNEELEKLKNENAKLKKALQSFLNT